MKTWWRRLSGFSARVARGVATVSRRAWGAFDVRDLHCYAGAAVASAGVWGFDPRVAAICLGVFLAWLGVRR
jgi:hypothetical protein